MSEHGDDDLTCEMSFAIEDIHLLYHCVSHRLETWKETPSNDPFEEEHLISMKDWLYRAILEYKFYYMDPDGRT